MTKPKFSIKNESTGKTGKLVISGFITPEENAAKDVLNTVKTLANKYDKIHLDIINCYGGSVYEGLPIYAELRNSGKHITTKITGLAASMGSVIFQAGDTRIQPKFARQVIHRAKGAVAGNADEIKHYAENVQQMENDLIEIYSERTGLSKEEVVSRFMDGKDHYLNGAEALKLNLCTQVTDDAVKNDIPVNVLQNSDYEAIANLYNKQIFNQTDNDMNLLALITQVNAYVENKLSETASEADLIKAVNTLATRATTAEAKVTELTNSINKQKDDAAVALIEGAITAGKLKPAQKDSFLALAKNDYKSTAEVLNVMVGHKSAAEQVNNAAEAEANKEFQGKSYQAIMNMKGGSDYLTALQTSNAEYFNKLKAAYTKPVAA